MMPAVLRSRLAGAVQGAPFRSEDPQDLGNPRRCRSRAPAPAAGLLVAALLPLGCRSPDPLLTYDLVHSLPASTPVAADLRIDFGAAEARGSMVSGWSWNETAPDGTTFVWGTGAESIVELHLNGLGPTELRFRAQPLPAAGHRAAPRAVEVAVGDQTIARAELIGGFTEHRLAVDPALWPTTDVRLRLRHLPPPPAPSGRGQRRLAVAWDWLELGLPRPAPLSGVAPPAAGRFRLELPPALRLDYAVDLEAGSRLVIDRVEPEPRALLVVLTPRGGSPRPLRVGADGVVDLGIERLTVATLSLLADPEVLAEGETLVLRRPRILRPTP